jgi:hypothetical protein
VRKGKTSAIAIARARILLKADQDKDGEARSDVRVAEALDISPPRRSSMFADDGWKKDWKQQWCLPKKHDGEFVWRMEDVLEVYHRPYNPGFPVICIDEASKQLVGEVRHPLPLRPGQPLRYDSEYERLGTCNIFMFVEPLRGYRHVRATERSMSCTRQNHSSLPAPNAISISA